MLHDFPAFALLSFTNVQMSEGTFCRVEVHIILVLTIIVVSTDMKRVSGKCING